ATPKTPAKTATKTAAKTATKTAAKTVAKTTGNPSTTSAGGIPTMRASQNMEDSPHLPGPDDGDLFAPLRTHIDYPTEYADQDDDAGHAMNLIDLDEDAGVGWITNADNRHNGYQTGHQH
ncbi:hypothetical protein BGX33_003799, partial [Mortierella sp. NVP41]